jgi:hypothetical protein
MRVRARFATKGRVGCKQRLKVAARVVALALAPAQEKQSALDELERQADLIELELAERERKLQARACAVRSAVPCLAQVPCAHAHPRR